MNTQDTISGESYQDRFGRKIAARLSESTQNLPSDISERLKAARMQALSKRKVIKLETASSINLNGGAATLNGGDWGNSLWTRLGSFIPLIALIAGLLTIAIIQEQRRADELAEVDVELLADDLPPAAYTDPGFIHFLTTNRRD
ncbi:MAG: DUF3619 family protein [Rhodoferax sp.]|jgi:hypothetical protein|nr:DUF3619 family protein [Rhodoferax sp.]